MFSGRFYLKHIFWTALLGCSPMLSISPLEMFKVLLNQSNPQQELGYDPHINIIHDASLTEEAQSHATIYLHGFGDDSNNFLRHLRGPRNSGQQKQKGRPYLLSCPAIFFDFPDAALFKNQYTALFKTSLGQISDILPFAYALNLCRMAGYKSIDVFGFSRGATTTLNTLAVLVKGSHEKELEHIGIGDQARTEIIKMLQNGCITLDCPLKSLPQKLKHDYGTVVGCIAHTFMPIFTRYRPWQEQAINAFDALKDTPFKMLIHYEKNDRMVTNWGDRLMYEKACAINKEHTYFLKSNDDGGHIGHRKNLPTVFHAFKQLFGWTEHKIPQQDAINILKACQPDSIAICDN